MVIKSMDTTDNLYKKYQRFSNETAKNIGQKNFICQQTTVKKLGKIVYNSHSFN